MPRFLRVAGVQEGLGSEHGDMSIVVRRVALCTGQLTAQAGMLPCDLCHSSKFT
jgi:hypothetical protein